MLKIIKIILDKRVYMKYTLIRTRLKEGFKVTLEELRSRLIEVCKGKKEFVESLNKITDADFEYSEDDYADGIACEDEILATIVNCRGVVSCYPEYCPFYKGVNCNDHIELKKGTSYEEFVDWWNETLNLAIASCKGEEVEAKTPADNPSKPLFIITKVDDLIGLESEDGKFEIKDSFDSCIEYVVVGKSTDYTYFDFLKKDAFNGEVIACLEELGFRFTIQERKSYLELLEECEEVEFRLAENNYFVGMDIEDKVVRVDYMEVWFIPGVKYISKEDADRIVKECVENA